MTIHIHADIRHLDQDEFGEIAYGVMDHVFVVHNEMGRFFDEDIYRDAVAVRVGGGAQTEVQIDVIFEDFRKNYYMDLLVAGGAVFELKAVNKLAASHRSQLLNYLLLCELSHGKLVNFRPERIEHEFVNTHLKHSDRTAFRVAERNWLDPGPANRPLRTWLLDLLRDIGTGLDVHLYEAAISHIFGGEDAVLQEVEIVAGGHQLGRQRVHLGAPDWAFKVTTISQRDFPYFEDHSRRFLTHTNLDGFHWINITRDSVTFTTIKKD